MNTLEFDKKSGCLIKFSIACWLIKIKFLFPGHVRPNFILPQLSESSSSSEAESDKESNDFDPENSSDSDSTLKNAKKKYKIPKLQYGHRTKKQVELMRQDFPNLKHHPDDTFRTYSLTELIRLDSKMSKDSKSAKKLTEKLQKNHEKCKSKPVQVKSGEDNRADILHEARFLGGHTCKNAEIWIQARKKIGITGLDPIAHYDIDSVGMNDRINSTIWAALHNPGSRELSIRMLSFEALKAAMGNDDKDATSPKKDFETTNELKIALATLRLATHFIHPWNFSVATLEFFLVSVSFGERDIPDVSERLKFVCEFIDTILLRNAQAWDDSNEFWKQEKIANKWISDLATKIPKSEGGGGLGKTENQNKGGNKQKQKNSPQKGQNQTKTPFKRVFVPTGVCRRYNLNVCPNQADATCNAPWDASTVLKHACCHQNPLTKAFCLGKHTLSEHK